MGLKLNFTLPDVGPGGGGGYCTQYKRPYEDMPPTWVAPPGIYQYINDPISMQNFVYEWVDFSIFSEVWAKIGLNLRKFEKQKTINKKKGGGNFVKILTKIESVGIWMGHFFLESWYMYGLWYFAKRNETKRNETNF